MVQVRLERVTKRFGEVLAVENISFTAEEGEFLALVGPSGCGKTTILRLIAGFEQPDEGDILFDGRSVLGEPPEARQVGMVFQNYALFPHMNVEQNIAYGLRFRPGVDRKRRVRELLELVDLVGLERRTPAELSAGERQRAALARALAPEPRVLLLDEPLSALDAKLRERLRLELRRLQRRLKITTIYVTHDQEEALAISDRVAVMSTGRIEQLGTPEEVYHRPTTEFVAQFIGRGNLLAARVEEIFPSMVKLRLAPEVVVTARSDRLEGLSPGQEVKLLLRPERLRVVGSGATGNRLRGRLRDVEFLGDAIFLHLDWPGGELRVKLPADELRPLPEEGTELELGFAPEDCYIILP